MALDWTTNRPFSRQEKNSRVLLEDFNIRKGFLGLSLEDQDPLVPAYG